MSIKYPLTLILSCFLLGACSDKGFNPSEKYKDSAVDSTVSDAEDLPECTDSREGLVILVQTEKSVFVCAQEAWAQIRTIPSVDTVASSVVDSRDGQSYEVVTIGSQVWMAENLNYETDSSRVNSDCYDYDYKCGRYYTWEDASGGDVCPSGFHLPDTAEWEILFDYVGGMYMAGKMLKSETGWTSAEYNGLDKFGFSILPVGLMTVYFGSVLYDVGVSASFWTSVRADAFSSDSFAYVAYFEKLSDEAEFSYSPVDDHHSVRCIKD